MAKDTRTGGPKRAKPPVTTQQTTAKSQAVAPESSQSFGGQDSSAPGPTPPGLPSGAIGSSLKSMGSTTPPASLGAPSVDNPFTSHDTSKGKTIGFGGDVFSQGQKTIDQFGNLSSGGQARYNDLYPKVQGTLEGDVNAPTGGYDPAVLNAVRTNVGNLASTGGYGPGVVSDLTGKFNANIPTGGVDPGQLGTIRDSYGNLISTGGYDPKTLDTINTTYGDFAKTGGFTPEQASAFIRSSTAGVTSAYGDAQRQAERNRILSGGSGIGGGELAQLARQGGQAAATADTAAETALAAQEREGKLAGAGGLETTQRDIAGNKLAATGGLSSTEQGVAGLKQSATRDAGNFQSTVASAIRSGVATQAGFENTVAGQQLQQVLFGQNGLITLLNSSDSQAQNYARMMLEAMGITDNASLTALAQLQKYATQPGGLATALQLISQMGGAAAGAAGALGVKV